MDVVYGIAAPGQLEVTKFGSMVDGDWRVRVIVHDNDCPNTMERVGLVVGGLQDVLDDVGLYIDIEEPPTCYGEQDFEEMNYGEVPIINVQMLITYDSSGYSQLEESAFNFNLAARFATALRISVDSISLNHTIIQALGRFVTQTTVTIPAPSSATMPLMFQRLSVLLKDTAACKSFTGLSCMQQPTLFTSYITVAAPPSPPPDPPSPPVVAESDDLAMTVAHVLPSNAEEMQEFRAEFAYAVAEELGISFDRINVKTVEAGSTTGSSSGRRLRTGSVIIVTFSITDIVGMEDEITAATAQATLLAMTYPTEIGWYSVTGLATKVPPSPPPSSPETSPESSDGGLSMGAIIAIAVGGVVGLLIGAVLIYILACKKAAPPEKPQC